MPSDLERLWRNPGWRLARRETDGVLVFIRHNPDGDWVTKSDGRSRTWLVKDPFGDDDYVRRYRVVEEVGATPTPTGEEADDEQTD